MFDLRTQPPIRVCYMIDRLCVGGTETQLVELINSLDRRQVRPHLCLLDGTSPESLDMEPADCPAIRLGVRRLRSPSTSLQLARLYRFLRRYRIQVLHTYFKDSTYLGAPVARLAGVPAVVRSYRGYAASAEQQSSRWGEQIDRLYHCRLLSAAVSNSRSLADHIATIYGKQRIEIIENGKTLQSLFDIARAPLTDLEDRKPVVASLGMLRPVKRHDLLIEAAALLAGQELRLHFRVGGEGNCRQSLKALIAQYMLEDVFQLAGLIQDVTRFLSESDIFVLCSDSEGLSNALIEAMAAGRAVIATAVGGNTELVRNGVNGLLIPPNDSTALASALARLASNPQETRRLAERARATVLHRFDHMTVAAQHTRLYANLLRR